MKCFYLLLCLFFLNLFLRLCVAILCPFFFFPFGIFIVMMLHQMDFMRFNPSFCQQSILLV